jgi:two-component system, cell cycle sensor histidine kinase and response regulator CckA
MFNPRISGPASEAKFLFIRWRILPIASRMRSVEEPGIAPTSWAQFATPSLFLAFMANAPACAWIKDEEGRYVFVNEHLLRVYRVSPDVVLGRRDSDLFPANTAAHLRGNDLRVLQGGGSMQGIERIPNPDGTIHEWFVTKFLIEHSGQRYVGGWASDLTKERQAEAASRENESRFATLFQTTPVAVSISVQGRIVDANLAYAKLMGCEHGDDLKGALVTDLVSPRCREEVADKLRRRNLGEEVESEYDTVALRCDGKEVPIHVKAHRTHWGAELAVVAFITDLTERNALEEKLRQAQKLESIGRLAAGIAHDFNNLLQVISGYASLLASNDDKDGAVAEIRWAADRAGELTRQLLAFSRRSTLKIEPVDLNRVLREVANAAQRMLGERVNLRLETARQELTCLADASSLQQVLLNLLTNARDAMPSGGDIILRSGWAAAAGDEAAMVWFSVTDTGSGMSAETREKIFEPFFTTKGVGKGTGLGLASAYGIVQQHRGVIVVDSELGKGTTFRVSLPAADAPAPAAALPAPKQEARRAKILLVEDDIAVRDLTKTILRKAGHTVLEAGNVNEALALWPQHRATIELLLTDMVMPGALSGMHLADRLRAENPELRAVIMTGYSSEILQVDTGAPRVLQKPFTADVLLATIDEALRTGDAGDNPS